MKLMFGYLITVLLISCWAASQNRGKYCRCTLYYRCKSNFDPNHAAKNPWGIGIIDIRIENTCNNYLEVCCEPQNILPNDTKIIPKPQIRRGCGKRNEDGIGLRITGYGNETQFGEFPWMVAILKENNEFVCGGSLIHPNVVLTAAHCVKGKQATTLKIRAGEWDTNTSDEIIPHQDRNVDDLIYHEDYNAGTLKNDFALLKLVSRIDFADNADVICLPERDVHFDYQRCVVAGWGKDMYGKRGQYQRILKKLELPVVPHDKCQATLRSVRSQPGYLLDRSFLCAGGESGADTCKGDGGGPLMCPVQGQSRVLYQAGIVSWGYGCGEKRVPGIYANVAYGKSWIDEKMALWGFSTEEHVYRP